MKETTIPENISVISVTASSFPAGVIDAYEKLHSLIPNADERNYFGFSHPNKIGEIVYKACADEIEPGEDQRLGLDSFEIQAGTYAYIDIKDHMKDESGINNAFKKLLTHPKLDPNGYCLEWYINFTDGDVRCMVPLVT